MIVFVLIIAYFVAIPTALLLENVHSIATVIGQPNTWSNSQRWRLIIWSVVVMPFSIVGFVLGVRISHSLITNGVTKIIFPTGCSFRKCETLRNPPWYSWSHHTFTHLHRRLIRSAHYFLTRSFQNLSWYYSYCLTFTRHYSFCYGLRGCTGN